MDYIEKGMKDLGITITQTSIFKHYLSYLKEGAEDKNQK